MWHVVESKADLPTEGGTYAVVYHGVTAWMYFNVDKQTWHPLNGWRKNLGQSWDKVEAWYSLPEYVKLPRFAQEMSEIFDLSEDPIGKLKKLSIIERSLRDSQVV